MNKISKGAFYVYCAAWVFIIAYFLMIQKALRKNIYRATSIKHTIFYIGSSPFLSKSSLKYATVLAFIALLIFSRKKFSSVVYYLCII